MDFWGKMIEALELMESSPWADDDNVIEVNLAKAFTILVLGSRWYERFGRLCSRPDPWMMNADDGWLAAHPVPQDVRRLTHHHRMVRLGDALATLMVGGNAKGSFVLIERLRSRQDLKSSFLETEIAAMLTKNGGRVDGVKESGIKGEDFDLLVTHLNAQVSVEVTAATAAIPSARAITNKLKEKASQVPPDRPAVLYLHVPASWMYEPLGRRVLGPPISRFMRNSHRFGMIVLNWEDIIPRIPGGGGYPKWTMQPIYSHVARHPLPDTSHFIPTRDADGQARPCRRLIMIVRDYRDRSRSAQVAVTPSENVAGTKGSGPS